MSLRRFGRRLVLKDGFIQMDCITLRLLEVGVALHQLSSALITKE